VQQATTRKITIQQPQTVVYPRAIAYDFEAYLDKTKRYKPTADLTYENTHVAISVSVGDTMDRQPTHICNVDPKALLASFMDELNRRATVLKVVWKKGLYHLTLSCCRRNNSKNSRLVRASDGARLQLWKICLNLIKQYSVDELSDTCTKVKVATKVQRQYSW